MPSTSFVHHHPVVCPSTCRVANRMRRGLSVRLGTTAECAAAALFLCLLRCIAPSFYSFRCSFGFFSLAASAAASSPSFSSQLLLVAPAAVSGFSGSPPIASTTCAPILPVVACSYCRARCYFCCCRQHLLQIFSQLFHASPMPD